MNTFASSLLIGISVVALAAGCGGKKSEDKPKEAAGAETRPAPRLPDGAKRELPRLKAAGEQQPEGDPSAGGEATDNGPPPEGTEAPAPSQPEMNAPRESMQGIQVSQSIIDRLDTNRDGTLSRDEVAKTPGGPRMPLANFESVDTNTDGQVSADELMSALGKMRSEGGQ